MLSEKLRREIARDFSTSEIIAEYIEERILENQAELIRAGLSTVEILAEHLEVPVDALKARLEEIDAAIDPGAGVDLTPSWHGQDCKGNGEHPGIECQCDECDHYLDCFPDWQEHLSDDQAIDATAQRILERFRPALEELAK